MSSAEPSEGPGKFIIALVGKNPSLLETITNGILGSSSDSVTNVNIPSNFDRRENNFFTVISIPDFFNDEHYDTDQQNPDYKALSDLEPWFILAVDTENIKEAEDQIKKLKNIFGRKVKKCVAIITKTQDDCNSLKQKKEISNIQMATVDDKLADLCKNWCSSNQSVNKKSTQKLVQQKSHKKSTRNTNLPPTNPGSTGAGDPSDSKSERTASLTESTPGQDNGSSDHTPASPKSPDTCSDNRSGKGAGDQRDTKSERTAKLGESKPGQDNAGDSKSEQTASLGHSPPSRDNASTDHPPASSKTIDAPLNYRPGKDKGTDDPSDSKSERTASLTESTPGRDNGSSDLSAASSKSADTPSNNKPGNDKAGDSKSEQTASLGQSPPSRDNASTDHPPASSKTIDAPLNDSPGIDKGTHDPSDSKSEQTASHTESTPGRDNGSSDHTPANPKSPDTCSYDIHGKASTYHPPASSKSTDAPLNDSPGIDKGESAQDVLSIILLGQTGTGKSASGNTILAAGKLLENSGQCFESKPSSTPVTTKCEVKRVRISGIKFTVVDTPDFFYEEEPSTEELEKCKMYCQPGKCLVLLVIQLGRFTDGEIGILEKLEESLGWRIRDSTIILFTHGEDLQSPLDKFINDRTPLKKIVEVCGQRYHVFKNTSKDSKQVMALFGKCPINLKMSRKISLQHKCCLL